MPFGLKNANTSYQWTMTAIFHGMLHDCLKYHVYDIVVKSKEVHNHVDAWEESSRDPGSVNSRWIPSNVLLVFTLENS